MSEIVCVLLDSKYKKVYPVKIGINNFTEELNKKLETDEYRFVDNVLIGNVDCQIFFGNQKSNKIVSAMCENSDQYLYGNLLIVKSDNSNFVEQEILEIYQQIQGYHTIDATTSRPLIKFKY